MNWAQRIKEFRKLNGLTQQAFAEQFGIDRTSVSRWENGHDEPALVYRRRILALTPTHKEGTIRGLVDFIDGLDGMATLLDTEFRVLRTTRAHQIKMGYDPADLYGQASERFWSAEMERIIKQLGGLRGYRKHGVCSMELALRRQPREGGFGNNAQLVTVGRTVAVGDPRDPACHLTTLRLVETDTPLPPCVIMGLEGPIDIGL